MNQITFTTIISIYTAYIVYQVALPCRDPSLTRKEDKENTLRRVRSLPKRKKYFSLTLSGLGTVITLIGIIGLFFLWPLARWFFLSAIIMKIFGQITWPIAIKSTHLAVIRNEIELLFDGALIIIVFYSPASQLFTN